MVNSDKCRATLWRVFLAFNVSNCSCFKSKQLQISRALVHPLYIWCNSHKGKKYKKTRTPMRSSVFLNTCSWWGPIPADIGQEAGYSMDRSPGQSKHIHKKCIYWYNKTKKNTNLTNARTQNLHLSFMLNFPFWSLTLTLQWFDFLHKTNK